MTEHTAAPTRRRAEPTALTSRIPAPDLARGMMLLLIAMANVAVFLHGRPFGPRQHIVEDGWPDRIASTLVVGLVDGRAFPLFALLYGYGVVQLATSNHRKGVDAAGVRSILRRRSTGLLVLGALHGLLLFPGDILGLYAVLGFALIGLLRCGDRTLAVVAGAWLVVACAIQGLVYSTPSGDGGRTFFFSFDLGIGPDLLPARALDWVLTPFGLLPVVTAALVGVLAARHRVLEEPQRHATLLRRTAAVLVPVAVLGGLPSGLVVGHVVDVTSPAVLTGLAVLHAVTGVAGGIGYVALFALVASRIGGGTGPAGRAMIALGRRSLSGYLFLSLVFAVLLSPAGFGIGATIGTAAATGLAALTWAVAVLGATALDRAGRPGPVERVLRRFTYGGRRSGTR